MNYFDGKQIRDEILKDLADKVVLMEDKPSMAVFLIGNDPVCEKYVELKEKMALKAGIQFLLYKFDDTSSEEEIVEAIGFLNADPEVGGIMIQIPIDKKFDRDKLIAKITPDKDIDGLRYCLGLDSDFRPPVVLAVLEALSASGIMKKITLVGRGFLVGKPLERVLKEKNIANLTVLDADDWRDEKIHNSLFIVHDSDIVISATGKPGIIKPDMVKDGAVLIDAGTAEENGSLLGDIDPEAYAKASYYTPVPGGIGPVTAAKLFQNLVGKSL